MVWEPDDWIVQKKFIRAALALSVVAAGKALPCW